MCLLFTFLSSLFLTIYKCHNYTFYVFAGTDHTEFVYRTTLGELLQISLISFLVCSRTDDESVDLSGCGSRSCLKM